jgi:hypothetical protein
MTELEQVKQALNNALNYLKNQDLSEIGRQTQGKLMQANIVVENLILHGVIVSENCNVCNKEITVNEFNDGMGECLACFPRF